MEIHPLILQEFEENRRFRDEVRANLDVVNEWIAAQDAAAATRKAHLKFIGWLIGLAITIATTLYV